MFAVLTEKEKQEYRKHARENDPPTDNWGLYHPVCIAEWEKRGLVNPKIVEKTKTERYKIDDYGKVYFSKGAAYGWKGSIGGLTVDNVLSHINKTQEEGETITITRESDNISIKIENFIAGMR